MARRSFTVIDIVEILMHWHAGRPKAVVAESLGVDRKTVRKYAAKAESAGFCPAASALAASEWAALVRGWFPELVDRPASAASPTPSIDAAPRPRSKRCSRPTPPPPCTSGCATSTASRRDLELPPLSVAGVPRRGNLRDKVTVPRPEVPPGEEAQIDYGFLGTWLDPLAETDPAGVGLRHGARVQPPHVRAARCSPWTSAPGRRATSRRSRSSAVRRAGSCRTT